MSNRSTTLLPIVLSLLVSNIEAQEPPEAAARIEAAFIGAEDMRIVNRIEDLPRDVFERFGAFISWERMADWGETWNEGDARIGSEEISQHIFSGVSDTVVAIVVLYGGITGRSVTLWLAERRVPGVCRYALGGNVPIILEYIQEAFADDGPRIRGEVAQCRYRPDY